MCKALVPMALAGLLLTVSCSKRERSDPDAEEWADIEALADEAGPAAAAEGSAPAVAEAAEPDDEFQALAARLRQMLSAEREAGQTLLTGATLTFDYRAREVRMDGDVLVDDDHGVLRAERLLGRFSEANEIERIQASGGVSMVSGERRAKAESALYSYLNGTVQLDGQAAVAEGANRLAGERIRFWIKGNRRMICEPNAMLAVAAQEDAARDSLPEGIGDTEIRANRIVYDEGEQRASLSGNVRLRNAKMAMNCDEIHLHLKDDHKIDWLEAVGGVIIQSEDRKALADRATYEADEGKFILEGKPPMVKQGRNVMTGDRITFWHEARSMLCEPNGRILYYYDLDEATQARFPKDLND